MDVVWHDGAVDIEFWIHWLNLVEVEFCVTYDGSRYCKGDDIGLIVFQISGGSGRPGFEP